MITWMQKHNKYLVITIWVATIAFIGAGAVGWGRAKYGSKATSYGRVGDIDITRYKFNSTYQNLYSKYSEKFGGKFDDEKARQLGLYQQTFNILASQAKLLNMAKEYGVIVSDKELSDYISSIPAFQENGVFQEKIYKTYLKNRRVKPKDFESSLRDDLTVQKLLKVIETKALPFERDTIASVLSISDKIKYQVVKPSDIKVDLSDEELKKYWEETKSNYLTPKKYKVDMLWTDTANIKPTQKELKDFYDQHSFNYVSADGKQFDFDQAKALVEEDYKIKAVKKQALRDYVAFKKGKKQASEIKTIVDGDSAYSKELWSKIKNAKDGDFIKPKVVGNKYLTLKIEKVIEPKAMSFEEAKNIVSQRLATQKRKEQVSKVANDILKSKDDNKMVESDWIKINSVKQLSDMSQQESLQFLQKLFKTSAKDGIIAISDAMVVYKIIDQKMDNVDSNMSKIVANDADKIKKSLFESSLFKVLDKKYKTQKYVKGI